MIIIASRQLFLVSERGHLVIPSVIRRSCLSMKHRKFLKFRNVKVSKSSNAVLKQKHIRTLCRDCDSWGRSVNDWYLSLTFKSLWRMLRSCIALSPRTTLKGSRESFQIACRWKLLEWTCTRCPALSWNTLCACSLLFAERDHHRWRNPSRCCKGNEE